MLDLWNTLCLTLGDVLLGWILLLPSDVMLLVLALITAALMLGVRLLTTDQDLLRRVEQDKATVKRLTKDARKLRDREALQRYRLTTNQLALRKLAAEGKPLLASLVPIAVLATWAASRVEYCPPEAETPIELVFYGPLSAVGEVMHLVPHDGLKTNNGWVQEIVVLQNQPGWWDEMQAWMTRQEVKAPPSDAIAKWTLQGVAGTYRLRFCFRDLVVERELIIGSNVYAPAWDIAPQPDIVTEVKMREVRLFGVVPGLGALLPAWLTGYLVLALPLVFLLKKMLRIY